MIIQPNRFERVGKFLRGAGGAVGPDWWTRPVYVQFGGVLQVLRFQPLAEGDWLFSCEFVNPEDN